MEDSLPLNAAHNHTLHTNTEKFVSLHLNKTLASKAISKTFFKYRSLWENEKSGVVSETTKLIFDNKTLWFSRPNSFNDPFDCNLRLFAKGSNAEYQNFLQGIFETPPHGTPPIPDIIAQGIKSGDPQLISHMKSSVDGIFEKQRDITYNKSSVFCWSAEGLSIPMFGYYSQDHKGVALEFEVPPDHILGQAVPVTYSSDFPELNYLKIHGLSDQIAKSLIFTKAQCWQHEQEHRVFRRGVDQGAVSFPPSFLRRVIFGANASQASIDLITVWLKDWPSQVLLSQASLSANCFQLIANDFANVGFQ